MKIKIAIKALVLKAIDRILVNDLYMAYNGDRLFFTLWDLDQYLRSITKYNPNDLDNDKVEMASDIRDKLYELMEKYNIDFDHVE